MQLWHEDNVNEIQIRCPELDQIIVNFVFTQQK